MATAAPSEPAESSGENGGSSGSGKPRGAALLAELGPPTCVMLAAGAAIQQTRTLFAMECAAALGGTAAEAARQRLANAASFGSFLELTLGPVLGRLSDQFGRKPFFLLYALVPTCTRLLATLPWSPQARLRCLYLDLCLLRACGVQAMRTAAETMISDVVAKGDEQTQARLRYGYYFALGIVLGSFSGGRLTARAGPRATYLAAVALGASAWAYFAARLPETHAPREKRAEPNEVEKSNKDSGSGLTSGQQLYALMADPEARLLTATLALHQFAELAQINDVHVLFVRETLGRGPEEIGLFASAYGMAQAAGNLIAGRVKGLCGPEALVTISHACSAVAFGIWGSARSALDLSLVLLPLTASFGRSSPLSTRFMKRAEDLRIGKGLASGTKQAADAVAKVLAPLVFMWLHNKAAASRRRHGASAWLRPGAPMLFVACLAVTAELLHRASVRVQRRREQEERVVY